MALRRSTADMVTQQIDWDESVKKGELKGEGG